MNFDASSKRLMSPATLKRALAIDVDIHRYPPPTIVGLPTNRKRPQPCARELILALSFSLS